MAQSSTNQTPLDIIDKTTMSTKQVLIILMCLVFNMVDGFDITAMAIVAKTVGQELSLSPDRLGWIFSVALAGMMLGAMLLAPLCDLVGRRKMIIASLTLVGVSIIFTANADSLHEFLLLRFISGLGAGALLASQATLAAEYSPERYRALAVGAVTAGYPMGAMMTSVFAGVIMPEYGWRGMFWFGGGMTLFMALVATLFIPESIKYIIKKRPTDALAKVNLVLVKLGKTELIELPKIGREESINSGMKANVKALLSRQNRRATLLLWLSFFLAFATLYVLMSWIPNMVENAGYNFQVGRDAFFWFNFGGVIGIFILGMLATRYPLSLLLLILLCGSAIAMIVFASLEIGLSLMMPLIFIIGVLQQGGFTGLYAAAAKVYPTQIRATGVGWCIGLGRSGAVIGPATAGYLIASGLGINSIFYIYAVPMILAGLISYALKLR